MNERDWLVRASEMSEVRRTAARRAVIETMARHLQRLYPEELAAECPRGRATVYRVLKLLAGKGLLCRVVRENGAIFYHACFSAHNQHVICTRCGSVQEIDGSESEHLLTSLVERCGYTATNIRVEASGLCPSCRVRPAASARF